MDINLLALSIGNSRLALGSFIAGELTQTWRVAFADRADLATLIHFAAAVPGVERIRFTTSHPLEFSDSLIEAYASLPQLANHLHLPVAEAARWACPASRNQNQNSRPRPEPG